MGQDEQETDAKIRTSTNATSELTNPLEKVKKTCQALESLNYDVRAKSQAQITILGQDEQETDFNEFNFWAHEPLRNGKKTFQDFESLNFEVRAWS